MLAIKILRTAQHVRISTSSNNKWGCSGGQCRIIDLCQGSYFVVVPLVIKSYMAAWYFEQRWHLPLPERQRLMKDTVGLTVLMLLMLALITCIDRGNISIHKSWFSAGRGYCRGGGGG